jgi:hypothetical protein
MYYPESKCVYEITAVSLKQWRRITVSDTVYFWTVQDKQNHLDADTFQRIIAIRSETDPQSKCLFISPEVGYFWLGSNSHPLIVTPKLVVICIRYATQHGWNPKEVRQPFSAELNEEILSQISSIV